MRNIFAKIPEKTPDKNSERTTPFTQKVNSAHNTRLTECRLRCTRRVKTPAQKRFYVALMALCIFVILLLIAPPLLTFFAHFDPNATNLSQALRAPGSEGALLGTDAVGRDVLLRTIYGGSESVLIGFMVLALVVVIGTLVGAVAGYFGGVVDYVLDKIITAFQAFPAFVLAIAIGGMLGQGIFNMVLAITAVCWTSFARLSRTIAASFKTSQVLDAARLCGVPTHVMIGKYLLSELSGAIAVMAALSMSDIILTMAGLSFIGLGPARPTNEWGTMIAEAQPVFQYALWCMLVPMVALFVAVILFNLVGDTLRDVLDTRSQAVLQNAQTSRRGIRRLTQSITSHSERTVYAKDKT